MSQFECRGTYRNDTTVSDTLLQAVQDFFSGEFFAFKVLFHQFIISRCDGFL